MSLIAALAACRFVRDAVTLLLWGASLYLLLAPTALRHALAPGWIRLHRVAVPLIAASLLAMLPVEAASLGEGWSDALDPLVLRDLLGATTIGTAWMAQMAATGLLLGVGAFPPRWRIGPSALACALLLAAFTLTGHAADREDWIGVAQRGCQVLHLLAGGFWFGALVPLLPTLRILPRPDMAHAAATALRRFSRAGHVAVALVLLTGLGNTLLIVGGWPDWRSAYQLLLGGKVALVAAMAVLAVVNRYGFVPRISGDGATALRAIRRATWTEIVFGTGIIALVAVFGLLDPQ